MFIETEGTPNPATLKFLPGREVMGLATADFASSASATRSPLATALFDLDGVARVFLGGDFISVTKTDAVAWETLKAQVLGTIMDHFVMERPVIDTAMAGDDLFDEEDVDPADAEIVEQIKELLDTRVLLEGGGIESRRPERSRMASVEGFVAGRAGPQEPSRIRQPNDRQRYSVAHPNRHAVARCSREVRQVDDGLSALPTME
jgi:hypothetical protein